ncbi:MAG: carbohydrate binding family 9 protein [Flaviaesturariibacter sp.]|nr:carbohydrate binding family 9 protein [Flaviaesturariibacter sp.]
MSGNISPAGTFNFVFSINHYHMRFLTLLLAGLVLTASASAQNPVRQLPAKRTTASLKIDGDLNEAAWKEAVPATDFIEWRPNAGAREINKTEIYILYDNTSIYVGGYCHEKTRDSISRELIGRDAVGVNDFVGVIIDTYNDKINAAGFYVTPYGEQYDAKYSSANGEDGSWNAVWSSEAKIHNDGWSFEMRIPYSALRFVSRENQTWGLNITRRRNKTGQQFMWNPVDPNKNGFINQEGEWTGIGKIQSPIRLSFSPYLSGYVNHYPYKKVTGDSKEKDWTTAFNGGMDVKYGISESFTLDMTLVPDFGQVRSDNKVLNLGPFEQRYGEQRPFFTEGTELFNKGNLFYSRRVGDVPLHYGDVYDWADAKHVDVVENPQAAKLVNATKVSGRTKKGLGIGVFNAVTKPMYAVLEDASGNREKVQTSPLTNYNIVVFDQTLKNNSSVSLINTNVLRSGAERDANVTAGLFDINNKKNTYNWNGKVAISQVFDPVRGNVTGYNHNLGFAKTGGRFNFQVGQELADDKYDINDLGAIYNNNYLDHYGWMGYKWIKPTSWYNQIRLNANIYHSQAFRKFHNQFSDSKFQSLSTNINGNMQFKNLWFMGLFVGYQPAGQDFYETRVNDPISHMGDSGRFVKSTERVQFQGWVESNSAKKYHFGFNYFVGLRDVFNSRNHQISFWHGYRFNDKFSLQHEYALNPFYNDYGFNGFQYIVDGAGNPILNANGDRMIDYIRFSRRNRFTTENSLTAKYNFSKRSGINVRARHYWSRVENRELYKLNPDGSLSSTGSASGYSNFNIFNIDAQYTLQFAPGSFIYVVYKDEGFADNYERSDKYFKSISRVVSSPQNNTLSVKIVYYLDYLDFKKGRKK